MTEPRDGHGLHAGNHAKLAEPSRNLLRSFYRDWFPWFVLALTLPAIAFLWLWPSETMERANRSVGTIVLSIFAGVLLTLWFVFLSTFRWRVRLATVLLVAALAGATVREFKLTGDWVPLPIFRWEATADDNLATRGDSAGPSDLPPINLTIQPDDCADYRGSKRDGIVLGPALQRDWSTQPPRLLWKQPVGGGYAAFAVAGNVAVTIEQRREREAVVCYDTDTGRERWVYDYPASFSEWQGGSGPRATPTIAGGDVYSLGALGRLVRIDGRSGKEIWAVDILDDNDNSRWGMCGTPLVYDDLVVVNPGAQRASAAGRALVAYDRTTGKQVWSAGDTRAGYSSPMLATLAGQRQILLFDGEEVAGYDMKTGGKLWRHPWKTVEGINVGQPIVLDGERVFISSSYKSGCAMLKVSFHNGQWSVAELWRSLALKCKFTSPVTHDGYIYGLDEGILVCLDPGDGKRVWRGERYGHGQLLLTGNVLVIMSEFGKLALVEATPEAARELGSISALTGKTRTWNNPALARGRAFIRNDLEMACYDLTGQ